jgi:hypothetical protein
MSKTKHLFTFSSIVLCVLLGGYKPLDFLHSTENNKKHKPTFDEEYFGSYYSGDVFIYKIKKGYDNYGHVVWLRREGKRIKTKYFAAGNAYLNYLRWKSTYNKNVIMITAGAYSSVLCDNTGTTSRSPIGLTVDNGSIVNRTIADMDGLVIVEAVGGIRISNLDNGDLSLESIGSKVNARNAADRNLLLDWSVAESATIFQTHLLAWKNKLALADIANNRTTNRRLLALAYSLGNLYYIVFDITKSLTLKDATQEALYYLSTQKGMDVVSIINLDTGNCDFAYTFNESGDQLSAPIGAFNTSIDKATNLLVFYRD